MTKNPLINALLAALYIAIVSTAMFYGSRITPKEDTILAPIAMLSLFSLSAATMGYIFLGKPVQLYLDGEKKAGVSLFARTVAIFAGLTVIALIALMSGLGAR